MSEPALSPQAQARLQQRVEELSAASIRALTGQADLHFRARRLHRGRRALPLFAAHLHPSLTEDDQTSFRGAADGLALRLSLSDQALHASMLPEQPVQRLLFDLLEQFRVEAMVPDHLPGVRRNLAHRFEAWSLHFHHSRLTESARGILLYTVAQISRARVTGMAVLEETEDLMEATRANIVPVIGHALAGLRRHRNDQAGYAQHALALAQLVDELLNSVEDKTADESSEAIDLDRERVTFGFMMESDALIDQAIGTVVTGSSRVLADAKDGYRIFTTAYDCERAAASLVRRAQLTELREQLDKSIAAEGIPVQRLARDLKALLAVPTRDGWDGGLEEGVIDGRRLSQLVSSPHERRLFRQEHLEPVANTVFTLLIDCSSSMRQHIGRVAALADTLARALDMAGVACEVLGHTTGAWHGGRAQKDWQRAGRPAHPGRLNELSLLVFKDADTPWRRARPGMAALLKADLFRESLDGEAVQWAAKRLLARPEPRRMLLVLSDGCPMDGATVLANDAHYLDQHLLETVAACEQAHQIQIFGLGVGLDLSPFYAHSLALDLSAESPSEVFSELLGMLRRHRRR